MESNFQFMQLVISLTNPKLMIGTRKSKRGLFHN